MLTLFPDEQIVTQSSEGSVTLTTHRICYEYREWGRSYNQSIMLEHITSCESYTRSRILLLILAVLSGMLAIVAWVEDEPDIMVKATIAALSLGLLYWLTRRKLIVIGSPSTKMVINATRMKRLRILKFINQVEHAKHQRILKLNDRLNNIV